MSSIVASKLIGIKDSKFKNQNILLVDNFNYLGNVFNYTGSFTLNQEYLVGKAIKALNVLLFNLKQAPVEFNTSLQLFDAFVSPLPVYRRGL
jgi:hypothetical protein